MTLKQVENFEEIASSLIISTLKKIKDTEELELTKILSIYKQVETENILQFLTENDHFRI